MAVNAFDVQLLNSAGNLSVFSGVETVTLSNASSAGTVTFTAGAPMDSTSLQIVPNFSSGDMLVEAPSGYVLREALLMKPSTLLPGNIKSGVNIAGVTGDMSALSVADILYRTVSGYVVDADLSFARSYMLTNYPLVTGISFPQLSEAGEYAFANCSAMSEALVPALSSIQSAAFMSCTALASIQFTSEYPVYAYGQAFKDLYALTEAAPRFGIYLMEYETFIHCSQLSSVRVAFTSNEDVTAAQLTSRCFAYCSQLQHITVVYDGEEINSGLSLGKSVSSCEGAFMYCSALSSIAIATDLTIGGTIPRNTFSQCINLTSIYGVYVDVYSSYSSHYYSSAFLTIATYATVWDSTIRANSSAYIIGSYAFVNCSALQALYLSFPYTICIPDNVFSGCSALTSLYIYLSSTLSVSSWIACTLTSNGAFYNTPMRFSSYTGAYGKIYVKGTTAQLSWLRSKWPTLSARMVAWNGNL